MPLAATAADAEAPAYPAAATSRPCSRLLSIVGLLLGTAWMARKLSGGKAFGQRGMNIVGGVALGPRERIVLVEVGDTWLVVGIVPGQIRTLHRMPKGSGPDAETAPSETAFSHWLKAISERRGNA
jgi:flagellar protein FliO/FliZ